MFCDASTNGLIAFTSNSAESPQLTDFIASGADALQSDLPDEVLKALGRPIPP